MAMTKIMGVVKQKELASIILWKFSGDEIGDLRKKNQGDLGLSLLPKYTLNKEGKLTESEFWLQYIFEGEEQFYLFDVSHMDSVLAQNAADGGKDWVFGKDLGKIFEKASPFLYESFGRIIPSELHILIETTYSRGGYPGEEETDVDIKILGHFDENFNFCKL